MSTNFKVKKVTKTTRETFDAIVVNHPITGELVQDRMASC